MKNLSKKSIISIITLLAILLAFCTWIFGWGQGNIMMMEFSADKVERIELSCTDVRHGNLHRAIITEEKDIQAIIDSVNSFQHTGSAAKDILRYGMGGTVLYEYNVYLSNGDTFMLCFGNNNSEQELSDMEVNYWIPDQRKLFSNTCKGSMELFYELYDKYDTTNDFKSEG